MDSNPPGSGMEDPGKIHALSPVQSYGHLLRLINQARLDERYAFHSLTGGSIRFGQMAVMYRIRQYVTPDQRIPFRDWLSSLRDRAAKRKVATRILRVEQGNLGDHKYCREGVWELRIDWGPGYRVYYGVYGLDVILLLVGGDKRRQDDDIDLAVHYWKEWQARRMP